MTCVLSTGGLVHQVAAYAVRARQRVETYGYQRSLQADEADALVTLAFQIVPDASWGNWSAVGVSVRSGGIVRLPIAGSQRYVRRVMHEIEAYQAGLPPAGFTASGQQPQSQEPGL